MSNVKTFSDLHLLKPLAIAVGQEGYKIPTPIQAQSIPELLKGRDLLGCAQTGTGKTAAFAVPILNRLGSKNRKALPNHPFVLALAPTRELAI
ncbi:MAG: DEAD/DEAH box helicase, partial [Phycisphaerae bacterium]|nr:DEAD/DEAH box helicase [Phycisphaerae bacterium]